MAGSQYRQLVRIRSGRSFARSADIDGFLSEKDVEVLYDRWKNKKWGPPITLQGGVQSITCDMVLEIGHRELVKTYGVRRAARLINAAKRGAL